MARWSTVQKLLQGGPFPARIVRPDLPVRVLRVEGRGVVVEVQLPGEAAPREVLVKVGGLRCRMPRAPSRSLVGWVVGALRAGGAQTYAALVARALVEGAAAPQDAAARVAAALGRLSRQGRLAPAGREAGPRGGKGRPLWHLRG